MHTINIMSQNVTSNLGNILIRLSLLGECTNMLIKVRLYLKNDKFWKAELVDHLTVTGHFETIKTGHRSILLMAGGIPNQQYQKPSYSNLPPMALLKREKRTTNGRPLLCSQQNFSYLFVSESWISLHSVYKNFRYKF